MSSQERAARRAVELDPDLAEARASLGYAYLRQFDGPAALSELERAVELKPSYAQAHHWLGAIQLLLGRPRPAREHLSLAVELSPEHRRAPAWLIFAQIANGEYEEALAEARRVGKRFSGEWSDYEAVALAHLGRWGEVWRRDWPTSRTLTLAMADVAMGDTAQTRERVERWKTEPHPQLVWAGLVQAAMGKEDAAFSTFRRGLRELRRGRISENRKERLLYGFSGELRYYYPGMLDRLREDARYDTLLREVNAFWGLNPDGSLTEGVDASLGSETAG